MTKDAPAGRIQPENFHHNWDTTARKKVSGAVIIASGFREIGRKGARREGQIVEVAHQAGIRVLGPNTTGVVNPHNGFTTSFVEFKQMRKGCVSFVAQTGTFAGAMADWIGSSQRFGVSKIVGLGNKGDVSEIDVLAYLAQDEETKVICMYLEAVEDGSRFLKVARAITRTKPIIVLKGGETVEGARAALSHTGSLAGRSEMLDSLCKQAGITRVNDVEKLLDLAKTFAYQPVPPSNRVAIVSLSGGHGVLAADACIQSGLKLARFSRETVASLRQHMPRWGQVDNPMDLAPMFHGDLSVERAYGVVLDLVLSDKGVDCCLCFAGNMRPYVDAELLTRLRLGNPGKAISLCLNYGKETYDCLLETIEEARFPVFCSVRRAAEALAALCNYGAYVRQA